ncbi:MAG TPA: DUF2752 domain-containing protein [Candidatus Polarisedimenticolia bacterium]|jgi:hypothetical protein
MRARISSMGGVIPAALMATLVVAAAGALYALDPATSPLFPPCPFRLITGLACPGCGTLRALHHLMHGRLAEAVRLNALTVALIPLLFSYELSKAGWLGRITGRAGRPHRAWGWALLGLILTFWVARNIL